VLALAHELEPGRGFGLRLISQRRAPRALVAVEEIPAQ